jgi:LPS export ABC transporter protein LptC
MAAKRKRKTILLSLMILMLLAGVALIFWGRDFRPTTETLLKSLPDRVDMQLKDVKFEELDGSGVKWELEAESASYLKKDHQALLRGVRVKFTLSDGVTYNLTGNEGRIDTQSNDVELWGDVLVQSEKGDRFHTQRLFFSKKNETISTNEEVFLENDFIKVKAKGMTLSLKEERLVFNSTVSAKYQTTR